MRDIYICVCYVTKFVILSQKKKKFVIDFVFATNKEGKNDDGTVKRRRVIYTNLIVFKRQCVLQTCSFRSK